MAEYTPGPWITEQGDEEIWIGVQKPRGSGIFDVVTSVEGAADVHDADFFARAQANARLIAAAPQLLDSLLAVEWAGSMDDEESGDAFDCCPNCMAPVADFDAPGILVHYAHCELRDSLDAALGVTSPRQIHPAHAVEVPRG